MAALLRIDATINQHIAYITPKNARVSSEYLHLALTGAYLELRAISDDSGSTKGALTCEDLKRFKLPLAPFANQEAIVQRVREDCSGVEAATTRAEREITLIREYRTRLVADVVTGKLDVREASANLLYEAEGRDDLEEPDTLAENGEGAEDAESDAVMEEDGRGA